MATKRYSMQGVVKRKRSRTLRLLTESIRVKSHDSHLFTEKQLEFLRGFIDEFGKND